MKKSSINEYALNERRTWVNVNPVTKAFKSKKDYNRHDKSWKNDI